MTPSYNSGDTVLGGESGSLAASTGAGLPYNDAKMQSGNTSDDMGGGTGGSWHRKLASMMRGVAFGDRPGVGYFGDVDLSFFDSRSHVRATCK